MKNFIGKTIRLEGRFKITTRLSAKDQAALEKERLHLESIWNEARQNFTRLYDAYLLAENQIKDGNPAPFFGTSNRAISRSIAEFTRSNLSDRSHYFEALHYLDQAAEAVMAASQRICNIIFHAYGGEGVLDMQQSGSWSQGAASKKSPEDRPDADRVRVKKAARSIHLASLESAAWIITQTVDRSTFYTALAVVRQLSVLGQSRGKNLSPLQKCELISSATAPLLTNLARLNTPAPPQRELPHRAKR